MDSPRELPSLVEAEVVVVGGGPAGLCAAISAARNGAEVLLIESSSFLGGNLAMPGLPLLAMTDFEGRPIIGGVAQELVDRLQKIGGATSHCPCPKHVSVTPLDPEMVKIVALEMALEADVRLLLHTSFSQAVTEDGRVTTLVVENKSGRGRIAGKLVVDATGDADVVARAGGAHEKGDAASGGLQPMTFTFRLGNVDRERVVEYLASHPKDINPVGRPTGRPFPIEHLRQHPHWIVTGLAASAARAKEAGDFPNDLNYVNICTLPVPDQMGVNASKVFLADGTDTWDLTRGEIEGRHKALIMVRFFQKYVPGFEECVLLEMAPRVGVRETRRIKGLYSLTGDDVRNVRRFDDVIARGIYPIDIHRQDGSASDFILLEKPYDIPYRCLVPRDLENVLAAGRCISVDRTAFGSVRVMPICMAMGQAAGTAAALCVNSGDTPAKADIPALQETLAEQGAILR